MTSPSASRELELKGRVREVLPSGELRLEHEPIMKIPFLPKRKNVDTGLLNLRLAGVELSQSGQQFLAKDLRHTNKPVTFTVIKNDCHRKISPLPVIDLLSARPPI
ncbi:Transthyretin-like family protein [Caenorhabditis elegans]|uniref:Transthyretin-like family protein n=1 Tax=Caenorhabditis elegans TaxID=6239 RepID=O45901_CAEEL|nr:Transthyretin-like family protein [Caenorhabditis elegans]CAB04956.1 Transthyretin-like family protein [Caenorhabditis elegans]|eukprot:NP_496798.1 Uncharacterized protein CELE_W09H1.3 [Caenorhabditis elegans]